MKCFIILTCLASLAIAAKGPTCSGFKWEGDIYVKRLSGASCGIRYCRPGVGVSGMPCPLMEISQTVCGDAKLQDEGCYIADVADLSKPYPGCCTYYKKICKGHANFDASKVPNIPATMRTIAKC